MNTNQGESLLKSLMIKIVKIILRVLAVMLIGFVSAVIGFIFGLVVGGTLAGIFEIVFGFPFVFNGREGYEATAPLGFFLGALIGLIAGSVLLFSKRTKKMTIDIKP